MPSAAGKIQFLCHSDPAQRGGIPYGYDKFLGCAARESSKIIGIPRHFSVRGKDVFTLDLFMR